MFALKKALRFKTLFLMKSGAHAATAYPLPVLTNRAFLTTVPSLLRAQDADQRTPLHFACDRGQAAAAQALLKAGAAVNSRDAEAQTP